MFISLVDYVVDLSRRDERETERFAQPERPGPASRIRAGDLDRGAHKDNIK